LINDFFNQTALIAVETHKFFCGSYLAKAFFNSLFENHEKNLRLVAAVLIMLHSFNPNA